MTISSDYVIFGQGLLGSLLALELSRTGASFILIEQRPRRCSSLVSAGMIDPISGQRFALSWRYPETTQYALETYQMLEEKLSESLIFPLPIYRLFRDFADRNTYLKKQKNGKLTDYVQILFDDCPHPEIAAPCGGITVNGGYRIDVNRLVNRLETEFINDGRLIFNPTQQEISKISCKARIYCTGAASHLMPNFSHFPFRNSRGETLVFEAPTLNLSAIANNGFWICPMGNNRYKAGATYAWEDLFSRPTYDGYHTVTRHIKSIIPKTPITIIAQESGTRSIMCDSRPLVGAIDKKSTQFVAAGLGSKGTQIAPIISRWLAECLVHQIPINPEISIDRFLPQVA